MKNEVMIFPTDTVYGIATRLYDFEGIDRIYQIKKRSIDKKIPVLCANLEQLEGIIESNTQVSKVVEKFWPGPLTIIVKTSKEHEMKTGEQTLAIRSPKHEALLRLLKEIGPLRTTSLNISGEEPLKTLAEVKEVFESSVDKIYEFDDTNKSDLSSTIVDLTQEKIKILRVGAITEQQLQEV